MKPVCAHCGAELSPDQQILLDEQGWPIRGASREGLGLPILHMPRRSFLICIDGQPAERVVGFDREEGFILRTRVDGQGRPLREPGLAGARLLVERVDGDITISAGSA